MSTLIRIHFLVLFHDPSLWKLCFLKIFQVWKFENSIFPLQCEPWKCRYLEKKWPILPSDEDFIFRYLWLCYFHSFHSSKDDRKVLLYAKTWGQMHFLINGIAIFRLIWTYQWVVKFFTAYTIWPEEYVETVLSILLLWCLCFTHKQQNNSSIL